MLMTCTELVASAGEGRVQQHCAPGGDPRDPRDPQRVLSVAGQQLSGAQR